jgi:Domain of unknown function (DUF222)
VETGGVEQIRIAIDALAAVEVMGISQRDELAGLWQQMARLDAQFARHVAEFDTSVEWSVDGSRSAPSWLVRNHRLATGESHGRVRVARQIAQMPIAFTAWQDGRISSRHVDVLTSIRHAANADTEFAAFEQYVVDVALTHTPEEVAVVGRRWRDALDDHLGRDGSNSKKQKKDAEHERRRANFSRTLNGIGILDGTFDTEGAEIIETGLNRCYERNHRADDPRSPAQQRADAIVDIFQHYLDHQDRGVNRPHLMVAVDGTTLAAEGVGRCETLRGYQLHPETVRRLACDAFIQRIVLDPNGVPLDLGRATRTFTPDQYRAIMIRDGGCRIPDCDAGPEDCQAHHTDYWENGGRTDLAVGLAVCRGAGHHRMIHEGGWTISGDPNGEITFHDPDGNPRGTSRPRVPPKPILTRAGRDIARARKRALALNCCATV